VSCSPFQNIIDPFLYDSHLSSKIHSEEISLLLNDVECETDSERGKLRVLRSKVKTQGRQTQRGERNETPRGELKHLNLVQNY